MRRLQHNGGHRRLDPVKQPDHHRHLTEGDVHPGQGYQEKQRRQHEQHAGNHAAQVRCISQPM